MPKWASFLQGQVVIKLLKHSALAILRDQADTRGAVMVIQAVLFDVQGTSID
jgi:hypothetical protein